MLVSVTCVLVMALKSDAAGDVDFDAGSVGGSEVSCEIGADFPVEIGEVVQVRRYVSKWGRGEVGDPRRLSNVTQFGVERLRYLSLYEDCVSKMQKDYIDGLALGKATAIYQDL